MGLFDEDDEKKEGEAAKAKPADFHVVKCPRCGAQDFDTRSTQWELLRICRQCKEEWSGGSMGVAQPSIGSDRPPPPGVTAIDDVPLVRDYSPPFRRGGR